MFIGRSRELNKLNALYNSNQFEFAVFYGRRRVGKTMLINEFIERKKAVYYMAVEGTKKENLTGLSKAFLQDSLAPLSQFGDYEDLLAYIDQLALTGERYIIAIDEFPYLAASYPVISSLLQKHIDHCWKSSNLFLILCGSSMSFMEEQVLGYKSPLYGRRTAQFKIHPFTFFEARQMLTAFTSEEQAVLYGVTGGIPEYLSRINPSISLDKNLIELFFDESGRLFEEPVNLLKQELREPATYHSIISAIAGGASRLNEIAGKTGLETSGCSNQIASLIALGIIRKETPVTEPATSRKTIYRLEDSMFLTSAVLPVALGKRFIIKWSLPISVILWDIFLKTSASSISTTLKFMLHYRSFLEVLENGGEIILLRNVRRKLTLWLCRMIRHC